MLTKGLTKIGNSLGVIVPRDILRVTGSDENTIYKIEVQGEDIILKKVSQKEVHDFAMKKAREVMKTQSPVLKKLAE